MKKISALFLSVAMLTACDAVQHPVPLNPQPLDVVITKTRVAMGKDIYATTYKQGELGHLLMHFNGIDGLRDIQLPCDSVVIDNARARVDSYNRAGPSVMSKLMPQATIGNHNGRIDKFHYSDVDGTFDHYEGLTRATQIISILIARDMERSIAAHNAFCPQP